MKTAVVICPGRGTYNAGELGYLGRHFPDAELMAAFDAIRQEGGQDTLSALDGAAKFSLSKHSRGDNASGLIYAATLGDFMAINREEALIGGQVIYPWVDEDWVPKPTRREALLTLVADINERKDHDLSLSIDLGGMLVLAGNEAGLKAFEATVDPVQGRFPMRLGNHAAFHTHLQAPVAERGRAALKPELFTQPDLPLIDGRGGIWWPQATDLTALYDYTLGHQVTETYDFTRAISVAAREFAPDLFIVTGPGSTLGGAVAQSLILADWRGLTDKTTFKSQQDSQAMLISMGMDDQRGLVM
ncbi:MAG: ACP S-malonyltransferase [Maritimibacter sp.]